MAKKREIKIQSDFVDNQKRVEKDSRPGYSSDLDGNFYMGYNGGFQNYIGQTSTSPYEILYRSEKKGVRPESLKLQASI